MLNAPELTPRRWTIFEGFYEEAQGIDTQLAALVEDAAGVTTTAVKFTSTKKVEMDTFNWSILGVMAVATAGGALAFGMSGLPTLLSRWCVDATQN